MQNTIFEEFYSQLLKEELKKLEEMEGLTKYAELVLNFNAKIYQIFNNSIESNHHLVAFVPRSTFNFDLEIPRHPSSCFLQRLRLEDYHVILLNQVCVRVAYLAHLCRSGLGRQQDQNVWSHNLGLLIQEARIQLMFHCADSFDSCLIGFLQRVEKLCPSVAFDEAILCISINYGLEYVQNWIRERTEQKRKAWKESHNKIRSRQSFKTKEQPKQSQKVCSPDKTRKSAKIVSVLHGTEKIEAVRQRISEYHSQQKKLLRSNPRRTIYHERKRVHQPNQLCSRNGVYLQSSTPERISTELHKSIEEKGQYSDENVVMNSKVKKLLQIKVVEPQTEDEYVRDTEEPS